MMFKPVHQAAGTTTWALGVSDVALEVDNDTYGRITTAIQTPGDTTYLILNAPGWLEVVRVIGWTASTLLIERGVDNTVPSAFPAGTPVRYILAAAAVQDIVNEAIASIITPANLTFNINAPNTVDVIGNNVNIIVPPVSLVSPDGTIDVTGSNNNLGIAVVRGAFGCCEGS